MRHTLLLLLLGACAGADAPAPDDTDAGPAAALVVSPDTVDFGDIMVADSATETVTLANAGDSALELYDIRLADRAFEDQLTMAAVRSVLIPPGSSTTFDVTWQPEAADRIATWIQVDSNDAAGLAWIPVTGVGVDRAALELTPAAAELGAYIGCEAQEVLRLTNVGSLDLVVSDLAYDSDSAQLTFDRDEATNGALPWTLAPGESTDVSVTWSPTAEATATGTLTVTSDDPLDPVAVATQEAWSVLYGTNVDTFAVFDAVDIVFAVDASTGSTSDVERLEGALPALVAALADTDLDYQVSIVLEDDGCAYGPYPYVDAATEEDEQLERLAFMLGGEGGALAEQGFTLLEEAFDDTNIGSGGCNEGLLRDDAALVLVGITDAAETSEAAWSSYVAEFQDLNPLTVHAIAGDYPGGCGTAEAGEGWVQAVTATDGLFLSVCSSDWESHLEAIVDSASARGTYDLTSWPVPDTIVVRVDGVAASDWTYAEADNAIVFDNAPGPGSTIEIEYTLLGDCE